MASHENALDSSLHYMFNSTHDAEAFPNSVCISCVLFDLFRKDLGGGAYMTIVYALLPLNHPLHISLMDKHPCVFIRHLLTMFN